MAYKTQYQTLFSYLDATFSKLLDCVENLSEADYKQRLAYSPGSLHDKLFHVLFWLQNWRDGLETNYCNETPN